MIAAALLVLGYGLSVEVCTRTGARPVTADTEAGKADGAPPVRERMDAVLRFLARNGPASSSALTEALGLPYTAVAPCIRKLDAIGLAEHRGRPAPERGYLWAITPAGRARLQGGPPALADACLSVLAIEDRPMTTPGIWDWLKSDGIRCTAAAVKDAVEWLASGPRPLARCNDRRGYWWAVSDLGREVLSMEEWEWAPLGLCLAIRDDRHSGAPGMSWPVAAGIMAWAGIPCGPGDKPPGRARSWTFASEAGGREVTWRDDAGGWVLMIRVPKDGRWETVRDTRVPDLSMLAWSVREIIGTRSAAAVTWAPGGFWAISGPDPDPAFAAVRQALENTGAAAP